MKISFFLLVCSYLCCKTNKKVEVEENRYRKDGSILPSIMVMKAINNMALSSHKDTGRVKFFERCDLLLESQGALQGVLPKVSEDSTGYFCFLERYNGDQSFEIILSYKGGVKKRKELGYNGLSKLFLEGCKSKYPDFDCYAFVLKIKNPNDQEDIHQSEIQYPVDVIVYRRIESDNWDLITKKKIKNWTEYSKLRFNTVYNLY
jgi:hypothetical protein